MKNVLTATALTIALVSVAMAKNGGGHNPRMEPFTGNVATATPKEKQSLYYQIETAKQK